MDLLAFYQKKFLIPVLCLSSLLPLSWSKQALAVDEEEQSHEAVISQKLKSPQEEYQSSESKFQTETSPAGAIKTNKNKKNNTNNDDENNSDVGPASKSKRKANSKPKDKSPSKNEAKAKQNLETVTEEEPQTAEVEETEAAQPITNTLKVNSSGNSSEFIADKPVFSEEGMDSDSIGDDSTDSDAPAKPKNSSKPAKSSKPSKLSKKISNSVDYMLTDVNLKSEPKSLAHQKLLNSSYPEEAELFCSTEQCVLGLTRGLVVGGDLFGMSTIPLRRTMSDTVSGKAYLIDGFAGVQILRDKVHNDFLNVQLGYRKLNFNDGDYQFDSQGMTVKVNYSKVVAPKFTQSVEFSSFVLFGTTSLNNKSALNVNSPNHSRFNDAASFFYRLSQQYPTYRVSLPADFEALNWSPKQTGFDMPLRLYAHVEPFFIQNQFYIGGNNTTVQENESSLGLRTGATIAYESTEKMKAHRFALKGSAGFDLTGSDINEDASAPNISLSLPKRPVFYPYIGLAGSWQF